MFLSSGEGFVGGGGGGGVFLTCAGKKEKNIYFYSVKTIFH